MSRKGNSRHIKRLAASKYMGIERKAAKYTIKPKPGRHSLAKSIALASLIRNKLHYASTMKEAVKVIKQGSIEVNGVSLKDAKQAIGYGDIIKIKPTEEYFKIEVNRQGAIKVEKSSTEPKRIAKILGKYVSKANTSMIRLHDGTVMRIPNGMKISTNDSVLISNNKIEQVLKLEQGASCVIYNGRHTGEKGTIKSITKGNALERAHVEIETDSGTVQTLLDNIIVTGASNARQ
ncbi:MAG: S4 domain-containing protein [Candidatus Micrarchaeaceae archaeon]